MILNSELARRFAGSLLQINAIQLQPKHPFTWASGWKSPIYCDNRLSLSYPKLRKEIAAGFKQMAEKLELEPAAIAGVATGGIAHGLLLAEALELPFLYVRSQAKAHGKGKRIEGLLPDTGEVLVVEDLISTGGSSLDAIQALREAGAQVKHLFALFDYGFEIAKERCEKEGISAYSISDYAHLLEASLAENRISQEDLHVLNAWSLAPEQWNPTT